MFSYKRINLSWSSCPTVLHWLINNVVAPVQQMLNSVEEWNRPFNLLDSLESSWKKWDLFHWTSCHLLKGANQSFSSLTFTWFGRNSICRLKNDRFLTSRNIVGIRWAITFPRCQWTVCHLHAQEYPHNNASKWFIDCTVILRLFLSVP